MQALSHFHLGCSEAIWTSDVAQKKNVLEQLEGRTAFELVHDTVVTPISPRSFFPRHHRDLPSLPSQYSHRLFHGQSLSSFCTSPPVPIPLPPFPFPSYCHPTALCLSLGHVIAPRLVPDSSFPLPLSSTS